MPLAHERWNRRVGWAHGVAGMLALLGSAPAWSQGASLAASPPSASTGVGTMIGTRLGSVDAFLGVPYATPPLGSLRFRPPQPVAASATPIQAGQVAQPCLQNRQTGVNVSVIGSEDCLYLNVYTPATATPGANLPVMVWFPGGGFQQGGSTFPYYNGQYIVSQSGVIVVTVTYRVGPLGNLTAPALDAESAHGVSGNYGIQDQQEALRWVSRNIPAFGGNPRNMTIFGESAGGNSVEYQLVSPLVTGLFARAIIESAAGILLINDMSLAASETAGSATVIASVGCAGSADVAGCLRALPATAFLTASGTTQPVVDGYVIPQQPLRAFRSGQFNRVQAIIGNTQNEGTAFVWQVEAALGGALSPAGYTAQLNGRFGATNAGAVAAEYPLTAYPSPIQALAAAVTDSAVACPTALKRDALARYVPVFGFQFDEPNPVPSSLLGPPEPGLVYGDTHTSDLPYVFGVTFPNGDPLTGKDLALSQRVISYWTNLAVSGNPNLPTFKLPFWIDYRTSQQLISLQDQVSYLPQSQFSTAHHCAFWNPILLDNLPASP